MLKVFVLYDQGGGVGIYALHRSRVAGRQKIDHRTPLVRKLQMQLPWGPSRRAASNGNVEWDYATNQGNRIMFRAIMTSCSLAIRTMRACAQGGHGGPCPVGGRSGGSSLLPRDAEGFGGLHCRLVTSCNHLPILFYYFFYYFPLFCIILLLFSVIFHY